MGQTTKAMALGLLMAGLAGVAGANDYIGPDGGAWEEPSNWSGGVPSAADDVTIASKTVVAVSAFSVNSLTLSGSAKLTVRAGKTEGVDYAKWQASAPLLWANRLKVTITGALVIGDGATLYSANDTETGTPVVFTCGSLDVAAGGTISSQNLGFGWLQCPDNDPAKAPTGSQTKFGSDGGVRTYYYNFGFGSGNGFGNPGSYGGVGKGNNRSVYGYRAAPFLPGSNVGIWDNALPELDAPGSIVIFAKGAANIRGTVNASAEKPVRNYGGNSGGGIWLCAATVEIPATAKILAEGGNSGPSYESPGGGGRIAIGIGLTDDDLAEMAKGNEPEGVKYVDAYDCTCSARAGFGKAGAGAVGNPGTALFVYRAETVDLLGVSAEPENFGTSVPAYGFHAVAKGTLPEAVAPEAPIPEGWRNLRRYGRVDSEIVGGDQPRLIWRAVGEQYLQKVRILGTGEVTVGNETKTADFEVWKDLGEDLVLTAGEDFAGWYGDFAGGKSEEAALVLTLDLPGDYAVVFADAAGVARTYEGAANGFWTDAANWNPAGVPGPLDDVTIPSGKSVRGLNTLCVRSLDLAGSLALGGMTANATTEQTLTDYAGGFSGLYVSGDAAVSGTLTIGSRTQTAPVVVAFVGGGFTLSGAAKVSVYAGENEAEMAAPFMGVYDARLVFTVGGDFTVGDTAIVYPVADSRTGTPVQWVVGGDFSLAEGAKVWARDLGFNWSTVNDSRCKLSATLNGTAVYSMAPGINRSDFSIGAHYGGGERAYGSAYVPFLPGSHSGIYNNQAQDAGGGVAWIQAAGEMSLAGAIDATGERRNNLYSGNSGGSIWLLAKKINAADTASLAAEGGKNPHSGFGYAGSGGRIALFIGLKDEQVEAIVGGTSPGEVEGVTVQDDITLVANTSVRGGVEPKDASGAERFGPSGTKVTLTGADADVAVSIVGSPCQPTGTEGPAYGPVQCPQGKTATFTATVPASVPGEESVRYTSVRWVCSSATGVVASGEGATAEVPVGKEPLTLTWIWSGRETRTGALSSDAELGGVSVDGGDPAAWAGSWTAGGLPSTFQAVSKGDGEFLYWVGDVPFGEALNPTVSVPGDKVRNLTAVFRVREEPTERRWVGAANAIGSWLDPEKWEPAGVPGGRDHVILEQGACEATNVVAVGSLTIGGTAILRIAAKAPSATTAVDAYEQSLASDFMYGALTRPFAADALEEARLVVAESLTMTNKGQLTVGAKDQTYRSSLLVGGDLRLVGTNKLCVVAGPTNETFTFAHGAGFVTVGGTLEVGGKSAVLPVSEGYTGGSVVFRANRIVVGAEASVDAANAGYRYYDDRVPHGTSPGLGWDFTVSGAYGGRGCATSSTIQQKDTFGLVYGCAYAPIHPGSSKGSYNKHELRGGGLIRMHGQSVRIDGSILARPMADETTPSSCSGGGIWVTSAGKLMVGPTAVFSARGGYRIYSTSVPGAGGRIALGSFLMDDQVEELARTGAVTGHRMKQWAADEAVFLADYPGVTIDVRCGEDGFDPVHDGTFCYLRPIGLMLLVK